MSDTELVMWVLYDSPTDFGPGTYVARKWQIRGEKPTDEVIVTTSLDELREHMILRGLARLHRSPGDDAKIIESWI